jgi:hypothetical protein
MHLLYASHVSRFVCLRFSGALRAIRAEESANGIKVQRGRLRAMAMEKIAAGE